jgi:hypothetical protein
MGGTGRQAVALDAQEGGGVVVGVSCRWDEFCGVS